MILASEPESAHISGVTTADSGSASGIVSCGSRRWYCAWTHPGQETRAEWSVMELGFRAFLPLHLEEGAIPGETRVVPLFQRYLIVQFDPGADQWRRIYRARGIAGIIGQNTAKPTPFPSGVIEDLLSRTSDRRIVDDPGAPPPVQTPSKASHWQDITRLSAKARSDLLLRLFGEGAT